MKNYEIRWKLYIDWWWITMDIVLWKKYYDDVKKKEVTSKNTYYFKNMKDAINSYIDKKLKEKETVSEVIEELKILLNKQYEIRT